MNYSYPPLLYQRGEEDEDDESVCEGECDEDEEDEQLEDDILVNGEDNEEMSDDDYDNSQIDDGQLGELPNFDEEDDLFNLN